MTHHLKIQDRCQVVCHVLFVPTQHVGTPSYSREQQVVRSVRRAHQFQNLIVHLIGKAFVIDAFLAQCYRKTFIMLKLVVRSVQIVALRYQIQVGSKAIPHCKIMKQNIRDVCFVMNYQLIQVKQGSHQQVLGEVREVVGDAVALEGEGERVGTQIPE
eukprot:TRINITY_DN797_c0_g2_i3.p3 TRINITY_DN797_c0_g2~~TRINITY_DN797_c0_g2_i3.p3  ORF type:complete len:158 (-),score=1.60 TRINITY_DN797_c0_g2_i3:266-739(-)